MLCHCAKTGAAWETNSSHDTQNKLVILRLAEFTISLQRDLIAKGAHMYVPWLSCFILEMSQRNGMMFNKHLLLIFHFCSIIF
jgi:hypothetical protein